MDAPQNNEPVYLEFSDERSDKFYEVTVTEFTVTVRYGRIGTEGQTSSSTYDTHQKAQAAANKKINEKLKKGYARSPTFHSPSPNPLKSIPYWLPEDFQVYTNAQGTVCTNPGGMQGFQARILPTVNQYIGEDGGYVAFYSRDPAKAVYSVGGGIYVVGQIRLKGRYIGRIFHPEGYEHQDISAAPAFKALCRHTFGVEGWAGGDTGGWFGQKNQPSRNERKMENFPEVMQNSSAFEAIAPALSLTLQAGEEVLWETARVQVHCTIQIVAISHSPSFSFNLMAGRDFAYHFNPRTTEAQIVQNTYTLGHWGFEERLPLPPELAFGQKFELAIAVRETELILYLNNQLLYPYRHRIMPEQVNAMRFICAAGSLQVLSVKVGSLAKC